MGNQRSTIAQIRDGQPQVDGYLQMLGFKGANDIATELRKNTTLEELLLADNAIGDDGAVVFGEALKVNSSLTLLNLSLNEIGDRGAIALAESLPTNKTLSTLILRGNQLTAKGVEAFRDALKQNSTLKMLDLTGNINVGDEGAGAVAEIMRHNEAMEAFGLEGCGVSEKGAHALLEGLKSNPPCCFLSLAQNSVSAQLLADIEAALERNKKSPLRTHPKTSAPLASPKKESGSGVLVSSEEDA